MEEVDFIYLFIYFFGKGKGGLHFLPLHLAGSDSLRPWPGRMANSPSDHPEERPRNPGRGPGSPWRGSIFPRRFGAGGPCSAGRSWVFPERRSRSAAGFGIAFWSWWYKTRHCPIRFENWMIAVRMLFIFLFIYFSIVVFSERNRIFPPPPSATLFFFLSLSGEGEAKANGSHKYLSFPAEG